MHSNFGLIQISKQCRFRCRWDVWKFPSESKLMKLWKWVYSASNGSNFFLPTFAPCPLIPIFNLIPNAVQVLNLVQSSLQVFFGLLILNFEFFLTFWTCQNSKITLHIGFHSGLRRFLLSWSKPAAAHWYRISTPLLC